jgi:hypothetical protein
MAAPLVLACVAAIVWFVSAPPRPGGDGTAASDVPLVPRSLAPHHRNTAPPRDTTFAAAFERGIAAYNADDVEAAADAFEEAVRLAPSEPEAHINLGLVYMRLQRPDDGLRELAAGAALERERDGTMDTHEDHGQDGRN